MVARHDDRGWLRPLLAACVLADGAVRLLAPRDGLIAAAPVDVREYFSEEDVARARSYVRGQLALGVAAGAVETAAMALLAARSPAGALEEGPLGAIAADGAALSLALVLVPLPFAALTRRRALRAGLATQSWDGWAVDVTRSAALGAAFAAAGSVVLAALMRHYGEDWWMAGSAGSVAVAVAITLLAPVLLDPIFNDFEALEDGELRRDVLALAERAGVRVGEVFTVDASRRTRAANAYVGGLGASRRMVLYDTLLETFSPEEARSVVAHELAHVRYRDVPRQLAFVALVAPGATRAIAALAARFSRRRGAVGLPSVALAGAIVSTPVGIVARRLSRAIERRADAFSLELTDEPDAFISFERRLSEQNLADPDPPRWLSAVLGTHPPITERIGIAEAYRAGKRPTRSRRPRRWDPRTPAGS
ncbi:MAG TPA: M48 family metalloprotease [Solirubrobacteraceae bacterium]